MKYHFAALLVLSFSVSAFATEGPFSTCTGTANGNQTVVIFTDATDLSALQIGKSEIIDGQVQIGDQQLNEATLNVQNLIVKNLTVQEPSAGSGWADLVLSTVEVSGNLQGATVLLNCENHYRAKY